jgi:hypothetical protein
MGARSDQPDRGDCGQPDRPPRLAVRPLRQAQVGAAPTQERRAGRRGAAPAAAVPVATVPAPAGAGAKNVFDAGRAPAFACRGQPGIAWAAARRGLVLLAVLAFCGLVRLAVRLGLIAACGRGRGVFRSLGSSRPESSGAPHGLLRSLMTGFPKGREAARSRSTKSSHAQSYKKGSREKQGLVPKIRLLGALGHALDKRPVAGRKQERMQ